MEEFEDIITIDNEEYVVVDELDYNDTHYIYVISSEDDEKISILKETEEDGEKYIESAPANEVELLMNLFAKKFLEEKEASQAVA